MPRIDIPGRGALLRQDMTLENLYKVTISDGDLVACRWLEGDQEMALTFSEYNEMVMDFAAYLRRAVGEKNKGRFVAIQMKNTNPSRMNMRSGTLLLPGDENLYAFHPCDRATLHHFSSTSFSSRCLSVGRMSPRGGLPRGGLP